MKHLIVTVEEPYLNESYDLEVPQDLAVVQLTEDILETLKGYRPDRICRDAERTVLKVPRLERVLGPNETLYEAGVWNGWKNRTFILGLQRKKESSMSIKIDGETLHSKANELRNLRSNYEDNISTIRNLITGMLHTEVFEGQSATAYEQKLAEMEPTFTRFSEMLEDLATKMDMTGTNFDEFDASNSSSILSQS